MASKASHQHRSDRPLQGLVSRCSLDSGRIERACCQVVEGRGPRTRRQAPRTGTRRQESPSRRPRDWRRTAARLALAASRQQGAVLESARGKTSSGRPGSEGGPKRTHSPSRKRAVADGPALPVEGHGASCRHGSGQSWPTCSSRAWRLAHRRVIDLRDPKLAVRGRCGRGAVKADPAAGPARWNTSSQGARSAGPAAGRPLFQPLNAQHGRWALRNRGPGRAPQVDGTSAVNHREPDRTRSRKFHHPAQPPATEAIAQAPPSRKAHSSACQRRRHSGVESRSPGRPPHKAHQAPARGAWPLNRL